MVYISCILLFQYLTFSTTNQYFPWCISNIFKHTVMPCSCFPLLMHFCCCCMSPIATNVCLITLVSPGSLFSLFSLPMHSDILFYTPQQHTIHVVVSCIFHNLGSLIFSVAMSSLYVCPCLICY